jgi:predicted transcriptional regulator
MDESYDLTELQIAVMEVLWSKGEGTVAEVHQALLAERGLAPTTVATLLSRLEKRGVIDHRMEGRQYVYRATVSKSAVRQSMVGGLVDRLFGGDITALVSHLLGASQVDPADLARVKQLVEQKERAAESKDEP